MDTSDDQLKENNKRLTFREKIENKPIYYVLSTLIIGFLAGLGAYRFIVETSGQVLLGKSDYILKKDLIGTILKTEAVSEIEHLIEVGCNLNNNQNDTITWLMRVLAFIHGLNLEKDSEWNQRPMAAVESDIRYALLDKSIERQRQKVLGILQGFKAAFRTQIHN